MRYRAKSYEIEAIRFLGAHSYDHMAERWGLFFEVVSDYRGPAEQIVIEGFEEPVRLGDYVIKSGAITFTPCPEHVFASRYEAIDG